MDKIKGRFFEPSTWAGFAVVLEAAKMLFPQWVPLIVGVQTIFGGVAVVVRESGGAA